MFHQIRTLREELERQLEDLSEGVDEHQTKMTAERHQRRDSDRAGHQTKFLATHDTTTTKTQKTEIEELKALISVLEEEYGPMVNKLDSLLVTKKISYDILWMLFHAGSEVIYKDIHAGLKCAGKVCPYNFNNL